MEKALINDDLHVLKVSCEICIPTIYNFDVIYPSFYKIFLFLNKTLRVNNLKTRTTMNKKISLFVICVEVIIYLLLYNLRDCTFKGKPNFIFWDFLIFYQIFLSPQMKRNTIISNKQAIYELSHELPNNLELRNLR